MVLQGAAARRSQMMPGGCSMGMATACRGEGDSLPISVGHAVLICTLQMLAFKEHILRQAKGSDAHLLTARPPSSLYRRDSACAMAHRPRLLTFSAYSSTLPSGNLKRFCTTEVSSRILRPFTPAPGSQRLLILADAGEHPSMWCMHKQLA